MPDGIVSLNVKLPMAIALPELSKVNVSVDLPPIVTDDGETDCTKTNGVAGGALAIRGPVVVGPLLPSEEVRSLVSFEKRPVVDATTGTTTLHALPRSTNPFAKVIVVPPDGAVAVLGPHDDVTGPGPTVRLAGNV